jgi:hypothetical protein
MNSNFLDHPILLPEDGMYYGFNYQLLFFGLLLTTGVVIYTIRMFV